MKKHIYLAIFGSILFIFILLLVAPTNFNRSTHSITVTVYPYYLMLQELGVHSNIIIDAYSNPHTYTPKVSDYVKLEQAEYVVVDGFIDAELIKQIDKSKIIDPTPYRHGWFRLDTLINLATILKEKGINVTIPQEIKKLNKQYKGKFKNLTAVTLHEGLEDALSYYGIRVVRALVAHDDDILSINDLTYLKNTDVCLIIATSPAQVDMLKAYGIKEKVVYLNLMGRKYEDNESYLAIIKRNLKAIDDAAKRCSGGD